MNSDNTLHPNTVTEQKAFEVTLIRTNLTSRGSGEGSHDPIRIVEQFWTDDGRLIAENDPELYANFFTRQMFAAFEESSDFLEPHGIELDRRDPGRVILNLTNILAEYELNLKSALQEVEALTEKSDEAALHHPVPVVDSPFEMVEGEDEPEEEDIYDAVAAKRAKPQLAIVLELTSENEATGDYVVEVLPVQSEYCAAAIQDFWDESVETLRGHEVDLPVGLKEYSHLQLSYMTMDHGVLLERKEMLKRARINHTSK